MICGSDESTLNTPVGACSIKHCGLGCWRKKEEEDEDMAAINAAIKIELSVVEHEMRRQMLSGLKLHGDGELQVCQNTTGSKPDISIPQI